jgi:hypothetical protein
MEQILRYQNDDMTLKEELEQSHITIAHLEDTLSSNCPHDVHTTKDMLTQTESHDNDTSWPQGKCDLLHLFLLMNLNTENPSYFRGCRIIGVHECNLFQYLSQRS